MWEVVLRSAVAMALLAPLLASIARTAPAAPVVSPIVSVVPLGPSTEPGGSATALAVDGRAGRAFAAGAGPTTSQISVLDAATGAVVRTVTAGPVVKGTVESITVDETRDRALVLTDPVTSGQGTGPPGRVSVLDARNGRVLHSTVIGPDPQALALDERCGHFFALTIDATGGAHIVMVDTVTGRILHVASIGARDIYAVRGVALNATQGRLFVATVSATFTGYMSVIDARSGAVLNTIALGAVPDEMVNVATDARTGRAFVASNDLVRVLDGQNGRVLRTVKPGSEVNSVVDNAHAGHVFASIRNGVLMLDARTGRLLHLTRTPGFGAGVLVDVESTGRVFLRTEIERNNTDLLVVLDAVTGALVRTIDEGGPGHTLGAVDERTGRVFETVAGPSARGQIMGPGAITVRDARTGITRQSVRVGRNPGAIVVDRRTGAAFALDSADDTVTVLAPTFGAPAAARSASRLAHRRRGPALQSDTRAGTREIGAPRRSTGRRATSHADL